MRTPLHFAGGRGFTLIELLMVLVIMGIVLMLTAPRIKPMRESAALRSAKQQLTSMLTSARAAAIRRGRPSRVVVSNGSIAVQVDSTGRGAWANLLAPVPLDRSLGVRLSAPATTIAYDPRGMANVWTADQSGAKFIFERGARRDSICVTRLGVVLARGCVQ